MTNNQYYLPHLEWNAIVFPLVINQIKFEQVDYGFPDDATITIIRESDYKLSATIEGYNETPVNFDEDIFVGKGNIIKGDIVTGIDEIGNVVKLFKCILVTYHTNSWQQQNGAYYFQVELRFDSLCINFIPDTQAKDTVRFEWFTCSQIPADFDKTTFRNIKLSTKKVRIGLDEYDDSIANYVGSSSSMDYIEIDLPDVKLIVSKVPDVFLPEGLHGICFEFRQPVSEILYNKLLKNLKHLISFLLGNKLTHVGYSVVNGEYLKEAFLYNREREVSIDKNKGSMPPIKFNRRYEWGNLSWLIHKLLPSYLKLESILELNQVLSRYWISKSIPVGVNLPILANAIEILASKYLKYTGKFKMENIPDIEYLNLIKEELGLLEKKLSDLEGGSAMINKIKGANKKVPSEKINYFFTLLQLEVGKSEKAAINLRNKMAHSSRDYTDDNTAYDDLILTRVYQVLFNRVMLKLLGYDGYYIDYSVSKCPLRYIDKKSGDS